MPNRAKKSTGKPSGWGSARRRLATLEKPALLALVKDLYDSSAENRDFIEARCQAADSAGEVLETYRKRIVEQFFSKRADYGGDLKLNVARKAIRDYRKATGNLSGVAELLMTFVENGAEFTHAYGDIDERFYDSLESVLAELADLLRDKGRQMYPQFSERLARVQQMSEGIGWGFGDFVGDVVWGLDEELG